MQDEIDASRAPNLARLFWLAVLVSLACVYLLDWAHRASLLFWLLFGLLLLGAVGIFWFGLQLHRIGRRPTISISTKPLR
jgi:hypothetical protein